MREPSLKDLLDQTGALLKANASEVNFEIGRHTAVDGYNGYIACWPVCPESTIVDVNDCLEKIRSLCTRLGNVEASQCALFGPDAVCCGTVQIASHKPDKHSPVVTILVFPTATVGQARSGLEISNPIIPLHEVPELKAA